MGKQIFTRPKPTVAPKPKPVQQAQLDANGNPIPPKPKPVQQPKLDANGNPILVKPAQQQPQFDANGNPITPKPKPKPPLDASGKPVTAPVRPPAAGTNVSAVVKPAPQTHAPGTARRMTGATPPTR